MIKAKNTCNANLNNDEILKNDKRKKNNTNLKFSACNSALWCVPPRCILTAVWRDTATSTRSYLYLLRARLIILAPGSTRIEVSSRWCREGAQKVLFLLCVPGYVIRNMALYLYDTDAARSGCRGGPSKTSRALEHAHLLLFGSAVQGAGYTSSFVRLTMYVCWMFDVVTALNGKNIEFRLYSNMI